MDTCDSVIAITWQPLASIEPSVGTKPTAPDPPHTDAINFATSLSRVGGVAAPEKVVLKNYRSSRTPCHHGDGGNPEDRGGQFDHAAADWPTRNYCEAAFYLPRPMCQRSGREAGAALTGGIWAACCAPPPRPMCHRVDAEVSSATASDAVAALTARDRRRADPVAMIKENRLGAW